MGQVGLLPDDVNVNLDRGYDNNKSRILLQELGFTGEIAGKGATAPNQTGMRWSAERAVSGRRASGASFMGPGSLSRTREAAGAVVVRRHARSYGLPSVVGNL